MFNLPMPAAPHAAFIRARASSRPAPPPSRLATIAGFPFDVVATATERAAARRIARRAHVARDWLHSVLGIVPRVSLRVLGRNDWRRHARVPSYGVPHVVASGDLFVGAAPADEWHAISDYFVERRAPRELARLVDVHGLDPVNRRGPALATLAETLIAHEVAHLLAAQEDLRFETRWLEEAFANYTLVAVLGETDPRGLRLVGSLAEAAATLSGDMPTLADFEDGSGSVDVVASVLAQLAITRNVYAAYAAQHTAPLVALFASLRTHGRPRDADYELGRMLSTIVHPSIAAIPARFASAHVAAAA
jgi:hypothetical protein